MTALQTPFYGDKINFTAQPEKLRVSSPEEFDAGFLPLRD